MIEQEVLGGFIYILPNSMSKNYVKDLKTAAKKNNFNICDEFKPDSNNVVVTNLNDFNQICKILKLDSDSKRSNSINFVKLKWLTDSNKAGKLHDIDKSYIIENSVIIKQEKQSNIENKLNSISIENLNLPDYECQRTTPLIHLNQELTNALEILEEYAEYKGTDNDLVKALAFRKAICVLKCIPIKVKHIKQIESLKHIGDHTQTVIEEILTLGHSREVERILSLDYYHVIKKFNAIYGCGPVVSNRLYELGIKTIDEFRAQNENITKKLHCDIERLKFGLTYFEDLSIKKITKEECDFIFKTIKDLILENVDDKCLIELMGGFKRGKLEGHDIDILISHPDKGKENELLTKIIEALKNQNYVIHGKHSRRSYRDWTKQNGKNESFDLFEKYIGILKFPKSINQIQAGINQESPNKKVKWDNKDDKISMDEILNSLDASKFKERNWIARRIDLIISPIEEFPFAELGWTGSKQFLRSIRLYSEKEFGYKLSSHGIFDTKNNVLLQVKEEKDIFDLLNLKYILPFHRNC